MASSRATSSGRRAQPGDRTAAQTEGEKDGGGSGVDWKTEPTHTGSSPSDKDEQQEMPYAVGGRIEVRRVEGLPAVRALETNGNG